MAEFRIVSKPVAIAVECPFCEMGVEIPWGEVKAPSYWGDEWPEVKCPECGKIVALGDWTYD